MKEKIAELKQKIKPKQVKPVLSEPYVKKHLLIEIHLKLVTVTIDKASSNFIFIWRKYYISKLLAEVFPNKKKSISKYSQTQKSKKKLIETKNKYFKRFDLKITQQDKTLPIMYWLPKMHKTPIGARFIVASKTCCTKLLSDESYKVLKMIFNHFESFPTQSLFYTCFKKFWVVENSSLILQNWIK